MFEREMPSIANEIKKLDAQEKPEEPEESVEKNEKIGILFGKVAEFVSRLMTKEFKVEGKDKIPQGGSLVISNHSSHFDGWALAGALAGQDIGVVVNPEGPKFLGKLMDYFSITRIKQISSHLNLSEEERDMLKESNSPLKTIMEQEEDPQQRNLDVRFNIKALNKIVDNLIKGKKIIYFPEGGFYEENNQKLRNVTEGSQAIARLYKRKTGKDVSILPASIDGANSVWGSSQNFDLDKTVLKIITENKDKRGSITVHFGEPFILLKDEDFNQKFKEHVGQLLPEYYR